jgi:PAS domain S-box-containing protein
VTSARILIAEDESITARDIAETLKSQGYDVPAVALSGEEAIQKAEAIRPDLVLMDIVLKGNVDGIAAAEQIRVRFGIPVVYLTAYADSEIVKRARITEPFGYITKPFESRELRTNIELALYKHKAEAALRQAEQEKAVVLGSMSKLVVYQDWSHRVIWANRAAAESVGLSDKELADRHCYEIWQGRDKPCVDCPVVKARETGRLQTAEMVTQDGKIWSVQGYPVKDAKGAVTGIVEVTENITERKKAEKKVRESEARYRTLFEQSPLGIGLATPDGRVAHVNKTMEVITGYFKEELKKINLADIYENPQDRKKLLETMERYGCAVDFPTQLKRKDGTLYDALLNVSRVRFGDRDFFQTICMDITERKQAEESLRAERNRAQKYLDVAGIMFVAIDVEGKVTLINKKGCEILGYAEKEIAGKNWFDNFLPEQSRDKVKGVFDKIVKGELESVEYYENPVLTKKGDERLIAWNNTILRDGKGEAIGSLSSGEDITERKQAMEQIEKLARFPAEDPNPVLRVSGYGTVVYGNKSSKPLLKLWRCRVGGSLSGRWYDLVLDALSCGQNQKIEVQCGEQIFSLAFAPAMESNYVNVYGRDITERKQSEKKILEYQNRLRSMASELSLAEERERRHIAEGLHDDIIQPLAFLDIKLDSLKNSLSERGLTESCNQMQKTIRELIIMTRAFTFNLSSPVLYELGLAEAVEEWLATNIREKHGIETVFEDDDRSKPLDDDMRAFLFKAVKELLINVVKHAKASNVKVSIARDNSRINICVEDNGAGFHPDREKDRFFHFSGYGLFSIRERLDHLGGSFNIESKPDQGTRVILTAPLKLETISEKGNDNEH